MEKVIYYIEKPFINDIDKKWSIPSFKYHYIFGTKTYEKFNNIKEIYDHLKNIKNITKFKKEYIRETNIINNSSGFKIDYLGNLHDLYCKCYPDRPLYEPVLEVYMIWENYDEYEHQNLLVTFKYYLHKNTEYSNNKEEYSKDQRRKN